MVHRILGFGVVGGMIAVLLYGIGLRIAGREETPTSFLAVRYWTENLLIVQAVLGIVFLLIGRRLAGDTLIFLHYFYGSLFPLIAIVGGRIAGLRRAERGDPREYIGSTWGAFFAMGLTMRALMTGMHWGT